MKRWQDCGEVLDSDNEDEDLSLSTKSGSQERYSKRLKRHSGDYSTVENDATDLNRGESAGIESINPRNETTSLRDELPTFATSTLPFSPKGRRQLSHVEISSPTSSLLNYVTPDKAFQSSSQTTVGFTGLFQLSPPQLNGNLKSAPPQTPVKPVHVGGNPMIFNTPGKDGSRSVTSGLSSPLSDYQSSPSTPGGVSSRGAGRASQQSGSGQLSDDESDNRSPGPYFRRFKEARKLASGTAAQKSGPVPNQHDGANHNLGESLQVDPDLEKILTNAQKIMSRGPRNLRARNQKQLHPYMFDQALYQRQCRERGIRPVPPVRSERTPAGLQHSSERQDDTRAVYSLHNPLSSQPETQITGIENIVESDDEEQHDFTEAFVFQPSSSEDDESIEQPLTPHRHSSEQHKRRKLFHDSELLFGNDKMLTSNHSSPVLSNATTTPTMAVGKNSKKTHPIFRMPLSFKSTHLATQRTNDKHQAPDEARVPSYVDEPRSPPVSAETPTQLSSEGIPTETKVAQSPEAEAIEARLIRERRRVKGVLPGSWLRIDLKAQQQDQQGSTTKRPLPKVRMLNSKSGRGIAVPLLRSRSTPNSDRTIFEISSDESETESSQRMIGTSASSRANSPQPVNDAYQRSIIDNADDPLELNWVDPMLAATSKRRYTHRKNDHRQPRIDRVLERITPDHGDPVRTITNRVDGERKQNRARPRSTKEPQSRLPAARRAQALQLSIIDAPELNATAERVIPQFIKVAIRLARSHPSNGRHSPSGKQIRLSTTDDTAEAISTLQQWREGTILRDNRPNAVPSKDSKAKGPMLIQRLVSDGASPRLLPRFELPVTNDRELVQADSMNYQSSNQSKRQIAAHRRLPSQKPMNVTRVRDHCLRQNDLSTPGSGRQRGRSVATGLRSGKYQSSSRYRQGHLETTETSFSEEHRAAGFARRITCLVENVARSTPLPNLPLEQFLTNQSSLAFQRNDFPNSTEENNSNKQDLAIRPASATHRPRKRLARRLDADTRYYRQPSEPLPQESTCEFSQDETTSPTAGVLHGLGPFGTRYSISFDILPLQSGTRFHEDSYIGSGDFAASISFSKRDLSIPAGHIRIRVGDNVLECGSWTQEVSAHLARIPTVIRKALDSMGNSSDTPQNDRNMQDVEKNIECLLRSGSNYFSRCLSFIDDIDRKGCTQVLEQIVQDLMEIWTDKSAVPSSIRGSLVKCLQYAVVLARLAYDLSLDVLAPDEILIKSLPLLRSSAHQLVKCQPRLFHELRAFQEDNRQSSKRQSGIRDSDTAVGTAIILKHVFDTDKLRTTFWDALFGHHGMQILNSVMMIDRTWYDLFTTLPIMELNEHGILQLGDRLKGRWEHSELVRKFLDTVMSSYSLTSVIIGSTINDYLRATLGRVQQLIKSWGWWRSESILNSIFDFFARRNLRLLLNEESHGSPKFLNHLEDQPSLESTADDVSFHSFLKSLACCLLGMRQHLIYTDKKIGSIAWRFIPNHGRVYRREDEVHEDDLAALRNHHDILCTLYYSAPPKFRPRVDLFRNLVNHSISHREACRINVKAWSHIASFQAASQEPVDRIEPFCAWLNDILTSTINQFRLARIEVEQDIATARTQGTIAISKTLIDTTISQNQRQISATLSDALYALRRTLRAATGLNVALQLFRLSGVELVFNLYDPSMRILSSLLDAILDITDAALQVHLKFQQADIQQDSEDSQDFGDSSALQYYAEGESDLSEQSTSMIDVVHERFGKLISNIFGADAPSDDAQLKRVLDLWTRIAQHKVDHINHTWSNYMSGYDSNAWSQLRDTEHKKRFTPYFLSCIVKSSKDEDEVQRKILSHWVTSLVEREGMLKFEHLLTETLLNQIVDEDLLENLPFILNTRTGKYEITLEQFRQRRLALISTVLSNMRDHYERSSRVWPSTVPEMRRRYAALLQLIMSSMKANYLEVQNFSAIRPLEEHSQRSYVHFVHQVITMLQQYTTSIQPIDAFFTNSSTFPLPASDPTYVVGKLKGYTTKLSESRNQRQLTSFFQSLCERAVIDSQQESFTRQLVSSVIGTIETGNLSSPSLRYFICNTIFPSYVAQSATSPAAWVFALPIITAWGEIVEHLLYDTELDKAESVDAARLLISTFLASTLVPMKAILSDKDIMTKPQAWRLLTAIFASLQSCLTAIEYISQLAFGTQHQCRTTKHVYFARQLRLMIANAECDARLSRRLELEEEWPLSPWTAERKSMTAEVKLWLETDLHTAGDRYFLCKNNIRREIIVTLESREVELRRLTDATDQLTLSYERIFRERRKSSNEVKHGSTEREPVNIELPIV